MKAYLKAALILCCAFLTATAFSHGGATGIVKERMDVMDDMADATKLVADMYKGKTEFDRNAIAAAIETYLRHGDEMRTLFPDTEHSRSGSSTEALPQIWIAPNEFSEQIDAFVKATNTLNAAFDKGVSDKLLKKQFFLTTKTCSNCHKQFRKPKK
ncbi:MAG: cytochrome c [Granulosicoccaceae bacterium]